MLNRGLQKMHSVREILQISVSSVTCNPAATVSSASSSSPESSSTLELPDSNVQHQRRNKRIPISIPQRIERNPTDILKALASTVGRDYTAAHYRYHDDPYLIPVSNMSKRSFALSKEAGKKAAKWIRQEHADLFNHKHADPPIEAFYPSPVYTEEMDIDQSALKTLINRGFLTEAIKVYEILKNKNKDISQETKQSLLELLCYYNETEPLEEDMIEERWYRSGMMARERIKISWRDQGLAERIFLEMDPPDSAAYCALIRGRAKYYQSEKAWHLYKDAESKGIQIDVGTFNSLLSLVNFMRESSDMRWQLTEQILSDMEKQGIDPNLDTMNTVLETVSTYGNHRQGKTICLQILSEFKKLGIEPSLASYYFILITHCKERGPISSILSDVLTELEGKSFTVQHLKDTFFFVTAMDICRNHLQDLELAERVNTLLHVDNNYDLIGDSFKESIYYRHYVAMKCNFETFDSFMDFYNRIVPNIYTPEPGIMEEILKSLELNGAVQYIPQFWSDMVIFDHNQRENLLAIMLQIMANNFPGPEQSESTKLANSFTEISWNIWTIVETQSEERTKNIQWSGKMLGDLMCVLVKGDEFVKASEVLKKLLQAPHDVMGVPSIEALRVFLEAAISRQHAVMSLACIQYVADTGFPEVVEMSEQVVKKVPLDSLQTARLSNMVGFDVTSSKPKQVSQDSDDIAASSN